MTPLEVPVAPGDRVHLALIFHNGGLEVVNLGAADVGGLVGGVDGAGGDHAVGYLDGDADVPAIATAVPV